MQDYVSNAWYMAAWAEEVSEALFSRCLLGREVLLTRGADGTPIALLDRCPHRFAPLSRGKRSGDHIVCGYHGLTFDLRGQCVRNPFSERIPASAATTRYPVVERDEILWIWFGAEQEADPATIPDFAATAAGARGVRISGHTAMQADYEYGTDNLLDLSHIEFVHTGTFAGNGVIFQGQHEVVQAGRQLTSNWWMPCVPCPAGLRALLQADIADHWLDMRWDPPASMYLRIGATLPGQPREAGAEFHQAHILTPAGPGETHYFWSANSRHPQEPGRAETLRTMLRQAFDLEDKPMIEAAYRNVKGDFWAEKPLSLGVDTGGVRARRILQAMKRDEAAVPR
jgi:phenylpropionate dioxygenase-like ring-hydroxylating dioxygenase large terminal subunit